MACDPINYTPDTYLHADEDCGTLEEITMDDGSIQVHAVLSYPLLHKSEEEKMQFFENITNRWNTNIANAEKDKVDFDQRKFIYRIPGVRRVFFEEYAKYAKDRENCKSLLEAFRKFSAEETYYVECRKNKIGSELHYVDGFKEQIRAAKNLDVFKKEDGSGFITTPGSIIKANVPYLAVMGAIDYESYYTFRKERPIYEDDDDVEHPEIPLDDPEYYPEYKDVDMERRDQLIIIRYRNIFVAEEYHLDTLFEMLGPDRLEKVKKSDEYYNMKKQSYARDERPKKKAKANIPEEEVKTRNFIRGIFHTTYESNHAIGYHPYTSTNAKLLATDFDSAKYQISEIRAMIGLKSDASKEERTQAKLENEIITEIVKANKREKQISS